MQNVRAYISTRKCEGVVVVIRKEVSGCLPSEFWNVRD